jgi:molybdopterin-guanine dinucleotide biosynthesis protein A
MSSGLHAAATPLCVTVPCDSPLIGADIARRLYRALQDAGAEIAVAHDGERVHPVVNIMNTGLADSIDEFLAAGERKIDRWFNTEDERLAVEGRLCPERK